jgi:type II secretory pathway component PulK
MMSGKPSVKMISTLRNQRQRNGFALLVVIVVMLLVSFLASQLILQVRTESQVVFNTQNQVMANQLAEAGVNLAIFRILDSPAEYQGEEYERLDHGVPYETELATGKVKYVVTSETGKIDLNYDLIHNPQLRRLLELFFEFHGLEPEEIATVIDSLIDWTDTDDLLSLNGAEKKHYEALADPYIPQNGRIKDPAEFFLINGTERLVGKFNAGEVFTVNNTTRKINYNNLTPAMLDFITNGDSSKKEAYFEEIAIAQNGKLNQAQALQIFGAERMDLLGPYLIDTSAQGLLYSVIAFGSIKTEDEAGEENEENKGPASRIDALLYKQGGGFKIISWKEQYT